MHWPTLLDSGKDLNLPPGYSLAEVQNSEIPNLIRHLREWYPDIQVGSESCHLNPEFYRDQVALEDQRNSRDILAYLIKKDDEIAAFVSLQREDAALRLRNRLSVVSPRHRGQGLGKIPPALLVACGKAMGAEMVYYVATLKNPVQQIIAEKAGFQLAGILPAYDRDEILPGVSKRVFEAIYIKVLVEADKIEVPPMEALTEKTKIVWSALFPKDKKA